MKIGKLEIQQKTTVKALAAYAYLFTFFVLFTGNSGKQSLLTAACSSGAGFIWEVLFYNYRRTKMQSRTAGR